MITKHSPRPYRNVSIFSILPALPALLAALALALALTGAAAAGENPITLELKDAELMQVLSSFASIQGLELEAESGLEGSVSMQLHQVPWATALDALCRIHTLECEIDGSVLQVAAAGEASPGLNHGADDATEGDNTEEDIIEGDNTEEDNTEARDNH